MEPLTLLWARCWGARVVQCCFGPDFTHRSRLAVARRSADEITYSERGNLQGAQFFPLAGLAYERALAKGLGYQIPTRLFLQDIRN